MKKVFYVVRALLASLAGRVFKEKECNAPTLFYFNNLNYL